MGTTRDPLGDGMYCSANKTVFLTDSGLKYWDTLSLHSHQPLHTTIRLVLGHDLGHAKQDAENVELHQGDRQKIYYNELQADCYDGVAMNAIFPDAISVTPDFYNYIGPDPDHGGQTKRHDLSTQGVTTSYCGTTNRGGRR